MERTYISQNEQMAWSQSKTAFADTVGNVNTIEHNSLQEAYRKVDQEYAKETKQADISTEKTEVQKLQQQQDDTNRQKLEIEKTLEKFNDVLGFEVFNREQIKVMAEAFNNDMNGKTAKDLQKTTGLSKSDTKGLEGNKRVQEPASPSDRKGSSLMSRIGNRRLKDVAKDTKKELNQEQEIKKEVKSINNESKKEMTKDKASSLISRIKELRGLNPKRNHSEKKVEPITKQVERDVVKAENKVQKTIIEKQIEEQRRKTR